MRCNRRLEFVLILVLFLCAFLPRVVYPVSRPSQWYVRSVQFIYDVTHGAWEKTIYSEHPGVTTMWLAGIALRLASVIPAQGPDGVYVDPNSLTALESAIGVFPLALVIAGLIVLMYWLLVRLFDRAVAFSGALLVALDPFFIANSQVLHVDGLLAAFMSTSALALLVYLKEKRWRWVILSGILGGLALLTKSPALFLLPYAALGLGLCGLADREMGWRRGALAGLAWLALVCLVYVALYPAMWVDPLGTPRIIYGWSALNIELPHLNPLYFLGRVISRDPGPAYYLYTWVHKTTSVVSIFGVMALLVAAVGQGRRWAGYHRTLHDVGDLEDGTPRVTEGMRGWERATVGLLFAFVVFFTLQMALGAKKMPRYLLPAFPLLDVLAGVGLVWWAEQISNLRPQVRNSQFAIRNPQSAISYALVGLGLLVQAALVLPRHPYYDTYFNELAGGARAGTWAISTQWQGEGLDLAARNLSTLPGAGRLTVGSHMPALFHQYFVGQTVRADARADWYVFGVHNVMRDEDRAVWDFYRRRQVWDTVFFDGIPYVWVYRAASGPQHPVAFRFEPGIQLLGYDVAPPPYYAGQTVRLQLYWQASERLAEDYTVFVHVLDRNGQLIAQQDNPPVRGTQPTSTWKPGTAMVDPYDLSIPKGAQPGEYTLAVGLYRWPDLIRLPVRDDRDVPLPDDQGLLATVTLEPEPPAPGAWIARSLAGLVALGAIVGLRRQRG